jgi:hypothetical protein
MTREPACCQDSEQVWYVLGVHFLLGILVLNLFVKAFGEFREREA